jgi:hypothetical protein
MTDEAVSPLRQAAAERPNPARPPENIPTPRAAGIRKPSHSRRFWPVDRMSAFRPLARKVRTAC